MCCPAATAALLLPMSGIYRQQPLRQPAEQLKQPPVNILLRASCRVSSLVGFAVKHTVAVSLKRRVLHLRFEFIADTPVFLFFLPAAGAVAAGAPKSFPDCIDNVLIGVECQNTPGRYTLSPKQIFLFRQRYRVCRRSGSPS